VHLASNSGSIIYNPSLVQPQQIMEYVEDMGFGAKPLSKY